MQVLGWVRCHLNRIGFYFVRRKGDMGIGWVTSSVCLSKERKLHAQRNQVVRGPRQGQGVVRRRIQGVLRERRSGKVVEERIEDRRRGPGSHQTGSCELLQPSFLSHFFLIGGT